MNYFQQDLHTISAYLSLKLKDLRLVVGKSSDQRLQCSQEILSSVKIIKMLTWETFFQEKASKLRN